MSTHNRQAPQELWESAGIARFGEGAAEKGIRRIWHDGRWFFSVIGVLTETQRPLKYWNDLKTKLTSEGYNELSAKIGRLKMPSADDKQRRTDAADAEAILHPTQSILSPKVVPHARISRRALASLSSALSIAADAQRAAGREPAATAQYTEEW